MSETVRAAVLHEVGAPLEIGDVTLRAVGPGEVRVRVAATGVCHSDLSLADGTIPQAVPAVLGHEGAGVVVEAAPDVATVSVGDHVVVSWIAPCRRCYWCAAGQVELCARGMDHAFAPGYATWEGHPVTAALGTATFAEETIVPAAAAVPIARDFPLVQAALVGCAVVTGVGAIVNAARVRPGESVAVVGCGGVGLAAVQGARLAGASRIVAVDRVPAKLAMAVDNGATDTVDAGQVDVAAAVREVTEGRGADHAVEAVGRSDTIAAAWAACRRGGTVTVVGAGRFDDLVSFPAMNLMVDAKTVRGCVYGATDPARDFPRIVELASLGRLDLARLVTRRIDLDDVNEAFAAMVAGEVARSVVVLGEG
jgi:S-(hydroxymethyl)glutathione dehydrogenase/alcohol dehydrogenase